MRGRANPKMFVAPRLPPEPVEGRHLLPVNGEKTEVAIASPSALPCLENCRVGQPACPASPSTTSPSSSATSPRSTTSGSTVPHGTFVCLLGPSGCGKTTLLRMIAGLEEPSGRRHRARRRGHHAVPTHKRNLGMVFQSLALFPHLSVGDNISYPLRIRGASREEQNQRVDELLEAGPSPGYADRPVAKLSGGQRQRVAIARALALSPKLFLLDEPLSALDAKLREAMQVELRQLQQQLGITTIVVTHDQREAMTMADLVVVMGNGKIRQAASPIEIYRKPADAFVADFIGSTNLLDVTADSSRPRHRPRPGDPRADAARRRRQGIAVDPARGRASRTSRARTPSPAPSPSCAISAAPSRPSSRPAAPASSRWRRRANGRRQGRPEGRRRPAAGELRGAAPDETRAATDDRRLRAAGLSGADADRVLRRAVLDDDRGVASSSAIRPASTNRTSSSTIMRASSRCSSAACSASR